MGTPGYAAPEQYGHAQTDARSDLYSLGVVLHELLTGHDPALTPFALPRARDLNPQVPPGVEKVIERAVKLDPGQRFASAAELKHALLASAAAVPVAAARPPAMRTAAWPQRIVLRGMEFVAVPAGEFAMGSSDGDRQATRSEKPQHRVYLDDYYIGRTPVTRAQYQAFVDATGHPWPGRRRGSAAGPDHPATQVSWQDAQAFCRWFGRQTGRTVRLPTEAEWEQAARGTDGRIYPWGDGWDPRRCNCGRGGPGGTTPVGRYSPQGDSPYGCADMAGNVWEWVADLWRQGYYAQSPSRNPQGPDVGTVRVLRGGSFEYDERHVRCAARYFSRPADRRAYFGFRVVLAGSPASWP
jgi:formylglycine-generating enzyme required for sulfatase activity